MKLRDIVIGTFALGSIGTFIALAPRERTLTPRDFQKATWIEVYNPEDRIWNAYMRENIPHNGYNWAAYQTEVKDRNLTRRGYNTTLPDLDGDGRVNP